MEVRHRFLTLLGCIVLMNLVGGFATTTAHPTDDLRKKKNELSNLRKEIKAYDRKIQDARKKERTSLSLLDALDRQMVLIRRFVSQLKREQSSIGEAIDRTRDSIAFLQARLQTLENDYASYVRSVYMHGRINTIGVPPMPSAYNELAVRIHYLKRLSQQHNIDMNEIRQVQSQLNAQRILLAEKLEENDRIITEKSREEAKLTSRISERKMIIEQLRKNQKIWKQELARKQKAEEALEKKIAELIERERMKKAQQLAERVGEKTLKSRSLELLPSSSTSAGSFKRGTLPWPVSNGTISSRFGWHTHPELKTLTQNTGIDIAVPPGTDVHAVADGEVAAIWWLPSFGTLIILSHGDGFRTVYAHLSDVFVTEGNHVKQGQTIGRSGESVSGSTLHFELWKDREKQDPEAWLMNR
ncbi:MAG: murein hydrolase activator EnvC family protein [Bacteroidota bacterium]